MLGPNFFLVVEKDLLLKLPIVEEADLLYNLTQKNRDHLRQFLGWLEHSTTLEETIQFILGDRKKSLEGKALTLTIWSQNRPVGCVSLHEIDTQNRSSSMGYWLDQERQGNGIMTKCVRTVLRYAFMEMKLHRIEMRIATHNFRSQRIAERLSFSKEGLLKGAIAHYGKYFDAYLYAKLNDNPCEEVCH